MITFAPPARDPDYALRLDRLNKTYHGKGSRAVGSQADNHALKNLTLDIPRGSIFGLLGPNGAGKSTMINILAGTVVKSSGRAQVWGVDIDDNPRQARANIGIVPQELNIDAFFTPRETLDMMSGLFGVPRAERRVDAILGEIGLTEQAHAYARNLSGGMRRRLLVGKAMVHQPPILVLDEPTAGVDVALRQKLWDMIRKLNASGMTIILTTHYLEEAEHLCDRIGIINKGELIAEAATEDLLNQGGRKTLVLTVPESFALTDDFLQFAPEQVKAEFNGNQLKITYAKTHITAGDILARLDRLGVEVLDVSTEDTRLEDIFLTLTNSS